MAPTAYVFTQTERNKREDVAKRIHDIHSEKIRVIESKPIDGLYEIVPRGLRLQYSTFTTASKISISDESALEELKNLLSKRGVTDPLILIQYETLFPSSSVGHTSVDL